MQAARQKVTADHETHRGTTLRWRRETSGLTRRLKVEKCLEEDWKSIRNTLFHESLKPETVDWSWMQVLCCVSLYRRPITLVTLYFQSGELQRPEHNP